MSHVISLPFIAASRSVTRREQKKTEKARQQAVQQSKPAPQPTAPAPDPKESSQPSTQPTQQSSPQAATQAQDVEKPGSTASQYMRRRRGTTRTKYSLGASNSVQARTFKKKLLGA